MVQRNNNIAKLQSGYLFPEITRRKNAFLEKNPAAKIISLGIGNTTEPITPHITASLSTYAQGLGTTAGYSGYGDEIGNRDLRAKIAQGLYNGMVSADEVVVSDGAKCDIGRLQLMFGSNVTVAIQDPAYPVYVDGSVIMGQTGGYHAGRGNFDGIEYMRCTPENDFFPDLSRLARTDLIYFCSPNNPTGAVATKQQLTDLVAFAKRNRSIIIFDSAYAAYIQDESLPKSIYEIEGARSVAIEVNSLSKMAGFTGVRLGWTIVPQELAYDDGSSVRADWIRIMTTLFNGASNIAQAGALAALDKAGLAEMRAQIQFYLENAAIVRTTLTEKGITCYGGKNAPYLWAHFPGEDSWQVFERFLTKAHLVTTPGSGFGKAGDGFLRLSAFGHRANVLEAAQRIRELI